MGTTSEKLTYLNTTKALIKEELNLGGANITTEPFRQYKSKLEGIYKDFLANGTDTLWNNWEKVTGSGTEISLNNTIEAKMDFVYKGNTSQNGTPTPDNPINIDVVTGNNSIKVKGKNLFDTTKYNSTEKVTVLDNKNGVLELQGVTGWYQGVNQEFDVISNQHYILSYNAQKINTNAGIIVIVKEEDNITELGRSSNTGVQTISFTPTTGKINVFFSANFEANTGHTKYSNIQLELGNQSSQYTPYQGQTYPINLGSLELCKIGDYQDRIYKDSGKWYKYSAIGKIVYNGSESGSWTPSISGGLTRFAGPNISDTLQTASRLQMKSNYFHYLSSGGEVGAGFIYSGQFFAYPNQTITTEQNFRDWLSTHNTTVYYVLATPTYTEITDTTLISQLETIKKSYNNQTNISQENSGEAFILDVTALGN